MCALLLLVEVPGEDRGDISEPSNPTLDPALAGFEEKHGTPEESGMMHKGNV
jgi:hypothetical protein